MSTIPPNWLGSIIQTQGASQSAGEKKSQEAASQAENSSGAAFADKLQNVIDNSDRDGQVYSDAEGQGSQGAPFEEPDEEAQEKSKENADTNTDAGSGLDVEA